MVRYYEVLPLILAVYCASLTFFDTAEVYGPHANEELVGEALASLRDQVVIATKFGIYMENGQQTVDSRLYFQERGIQRHWKNAPEYDQQVGLLLNN